MATGVKPRDEESRLSREDVENLQEFMKHKKFRDLLADYCEEIRDPANQALYQKEMTQLEKERGYDVKFLNQKGGYVIKTSVAGDMKAFINICSSDTVAKPSYKVEVVDEKRGMNWQIPYSVVPPREDLDRNRQRCIIYDVVFHPDTLRMAAVNKQFREAVNKTAFDGLFKTYNIHLDSNNCRCTKTEYKGMSQHTVIRKEDPNFKPPEDDENEDIPPELLEKLYPQHIYNDNKNMECETEPAKETTSRSKRSKEEFTHATENGYTKPKYNIKQQKNIDLQDFTYNRDCKQYSAIPSHLVIEVYLPLLSSTKDCTLDVEEKTLHLISEKPAKYKLNINLPYSVNDECGSAKFDKTRHMLIVTLPVIKKNLNNNDNTNFLKVDSGVESEDNSGCDEDIDNSKLIVELPSTPVEIVAKPETCSLINDSTESFFDPSLGYMLPPYTHNVLDDVVAFTFHVKNTEPDSVIVKNEGNEIYVKFTSVGAGYVPVHYAAVITFEDDVKFDNVTGEAWDNNVILQLELSGNIPQKFNIGLTKDSMACEYFDVSHVKKTKTEEKAEEIDSDDMSPLVEVTNLGTETNIVVSSNHEEYDDDDIESPSSEDKDILMTESGMYENGAKSILRKPNMMRSFSESSADVASSMDYISSDCIHEESSLKKTVRFNDVIARQFYRYNSSIEGQKKKNQRKKSKKRNQEQRKSESEAEDETSNTSQNLKPRLKSAMKQRRDSGLADTSDAETESKDTPYEGYEKADEDNDDKTSDNEDTFGEKSMLNIVDNKENVGEKSDAEIWETSKCKKENPKPMTCENVNHNSNLYDPEKLNKGQYLEVMFKNDLIFDLDM